MNEHTIARVEFDRILQELQTLCFSLRGSKNFENATFFTDAESLQNYRKQIMTLEQAGWSIPAALHAVPDIAYIYDKNRVELLELEECFNVLLFLENVKRLTTSLQGLEITNQELTDLEFPSKVYQRLRQCFSPEGELLDNCLPEYRRVQYSIAKLGKKIASMARQYLVSNQGSFQSDQPVLRNERTVLPLRSSHRQLLSGIVHGTSDSGATVFVEPADLVEENNKLAELRQELKYIIISLLRELTAAIFSLRDSLHALDTAVGKLDCCSARLRYAKRYHCHFADISSELVLQNARHPFVEACVPLNIRLEKKDIFLLVSGPNAGGKTVLLKTVALLILMQQCAIPIHADEGSSLPLFSQVHVEIGDEQSIDNALSTFTARMKHIAEILRSVDANSLVIIDELGSGTDPEEGTALAVAIIEALQKRGSRILCSSHLSGVKFFALNRGKSVSMSFDPHNIRPSYVICSGIADSSHALESAADQGLAPEVIAVARSYYENNRSNFAEMISDFARQLHTIKDERRRLEQERAANKEEQRQWKIQAEKAAEIRLLKHEQSLRELRFFLKDAAGKLEELVRTLREGELDKQKTKEVRHFLNDLRTRAEEETAVLQKEREILDKPLPVLAAGNHVSLKTNNKHAIVQRILDNEHVELLLDNGIRLQHRKDAIELLAPEKEKKATVSVDISMQEGARTIDVRGYRAEDAVAQCAKALNYMLLTENKSLTVIHGIGSGILRRVVRKYFSENAPQLGMREHSNGGASDFFIQE